MPRDTRATGMCCFYSGAFGAESDLSCSSSSHDGSQREWTAQKNLLPGAVDFHPYSAKVTMQGSSLDNDTSHGNRPARRNN